MPDIHERLRKLSAALVSDVLRDHQVAYVMDSAIRCLTPGLRLAGPAYTVLARAGSIISVHKALLEAPPGVVLVVGGETYQDLNAALFGKLMATQARVRGILGLVADAAVRDIAELRAMAFPVFARATTPCVGLNRAVGQTQVPVPCGGLIVYPGDTIVADDDGVAVIPSAQLAEVVTAAEGRQHKETDYLARIAEGEHLSELIGFAAIISCDGDKR